MSYKIKTIPSFDKDVKALNKRYPSLKMDLIQLRDLLLINPFSGTPLPKSCYKIRLSIKSKGKGKSGGARVITHVILINETDGIIYLLAIYDKSEQENILDRQIAVLLKEII